MRWPVGHETVAAGPMDFRGSTGAPRNQETVGPKGPTSLDIQRFPTVPGDPGRAHHILMAPLCDGRDTGDESPLKLFNNRGCRGLQFFIALKSVETSRSYLLVYYDNMVIIHTIW